MTQALFSDSVPGCIAHHCRQAPEATAFWLFDKNRWQPFTRLEFWTGVERYTRLFSETLAPGSLLLFVKRLDFDLLAAYIGAMNAGVLPAQLSPQSKKTTEAEYRRKIAHILELTQAQGIFTDDAEREGLESLADVRLLSPSEAPATSEPVPPRTTPEALVQFSSGSTGLQKGVLLTHAGLIAHMRAYSEAIALSPEDKVVSWLPLYHDMGLIACYLMPLMTGVPFLQMDPFDWILRPDSLLEAIEAHQATLCFLPNFAYHVLIAKGKARDLSSMRLFVNCSEPAREQTHRAFLEKFPTTRPEALTVCYALAENTFAVSQTPLGKTADTRRIGGKDVISCGTIVPGTEVRILEPDADGIGEIGVRGACLFARFLGGDQPLQDGFYRTGDLGTVSDEGEVYVTGRKKDLIISNGKNIYPQDVENACSGVPGAYPGRAVAFGATNEQVGSEELFVIVERDGTVEDLALKLAVMKAVEAEIGVVPKRVEVVDHMRLVKTSSGKISRARNKELYLSGGLS